MSCWRELTSTDRGKKVYINFELIVAISTSTLDDMTFLSTTGRGADGSPLLFTVKETVEQIARMLPEK